METSSFSIKTSLPVLEVSNIPIIHLLICQACMQGDSPVCLGVLS